MSTPRLTPTEQELFNALKAQLLSILCTLPLTRLKSMLRQAELISPNNPTGAEAFTLATLLHDALFQARNNVQDNGPSNLSEHYHMVFATEWENAEAQFKATNHAPLEMICEHWYLTGRIHEASAMLNAPDVHELHPFNAGMDDICTVCDRTEKEGNHGSTNPLDYSADADPLSIPGFQPPWEPTAAQLARLRAASEGTTDLPTEAMINDWNIHNDHAE